MFAVVKDTCNTNIFSLNGRLCFLNKFISYDNSIKKDAEKLQVKDDLSNVLMKNLLKKRSQTQISSQHEEMARYISSSWNGIQQELDDETIEFNNNDNNSQSNKSSGRIHYLKSTSTPTNFVPFDLESFWRERILQNLIGST